MSKANIMIVEDDGIVAEDLKTSLNKMGFGVSAVVSMGEEAQKKAGEDKPDLVLMDIQLAGDIDGIEAAGRIRDRFNIPVVYLTAYGDTEILERAKNTEPSGYLLKPYEINELNNTIEIALHKQKSEEVLQKANIQLEQRVGKYTAELDKANEQVKQEIQARKQMEKTLQQAQKMEALGTLAGGIAHDFNNILGAIIGHAEIMEMFEIPKDSDMHDSLQQVLNAGYRAKDLVQQILTFSRQTEQEKRPLRIVPIVKEAIRLLRATLPATIEIRQHIDGTEHTIFADPTQMHQILMNLCTNAGHAMRKTGGLLEVSLTEVDINTGENGMLRGLQPGSYVRLDIRDTGHGMTPDVMNRIFDPYFTTKEKGEGTGLGLSVVLGIVKSHGGSITVESRLGEGCTFHVYLPTIEGEPAQKEMEPFEPLLSGKGCILYVDDEKSLLDFGKEILGHLGYEVVVSTSGVEALEIFCVRPDRFDLVLTDMTMPHMNGIELAEELIDIRPDLPVILCSGFDEMITKEIVENAGVKEFIQKPFGIHKLANTIQGLIRKE